MHQGQICESGTRVLVHEKVHDKFVEKMIAGIKRIQIGDTMDMTTGMGPLVSSSQRDTVEKYVGLGEEQGAKCVAGGKRPSNMSKGYYYEPTIFDDVDNKMRIAQEEIFGPVVSVIRYKDDDEAVRIANDSVYGLGGAVWSSNKDRAVGAGQAHRHRHRVGQRLPHDQPPLPVRRLQAERRRARARQVGSRRVPRAEAHPRRRGHAAGRQVLPAMLLVELGISPSPRASLRGPELCLPLGRAARGDRVAVSFDPMPTIRITPRAADVVARVRTERSGTLTFTIDGGCCEGTGAPPLRGRRARRRRPRW